jgi:hypothetical protein
MAEVDDTRKHWASIINEYSKKHELKCGIGLKEEQIFKALYIRISDKEEIEWMGDVWEQMYSIGDVEEILKDFDFETLDLVVETSLGVIPIEFRFNTKVRIKSKGLIWIINRYDKDPFPSNPHAHQLESNIKLHLGNGECYVKKKFISKINKKELFRIREDIIKKCDINLPKLEL